MAKLESSLRRYDRIADRIRAHRQVDARPVLVVEGGSDERLATSVLPEGSVVFFRGNTRSVVLEVAERSGPLGIDRIACLVDRDFDDVVADAEARGLPVLAYDGADLEDMLLQSPSGVRAVEELASETKIQEYGGAQTILSVSRDNVSSISRLRRVNALLELGLDFDAVNLYKRIGSGTLVIDVPAYCMALAQASETQLTASDLEQHATDGDPPTCPRTAVMLVRGRDALTVVGVALRKLIATLRKEQTDPELLAATLRSSADREWLRQTLWYRALVGLLNPAGNIR